MSVNPRLTLKTPFPETSFANLVINGPFILMAADTKETTFSSLPDYCSCKIVDAVKAKNTIAENLIGDKTAILVILCAVLKIVAMNSILLHVNLFHRL
jgi:hypothetical protein